MIRAQRPESRLLTPAGPTDDAPATLVDAGALYAGATVARIHELRPAAELVRDLTP
jgi:nitronate monooxygenase